MGQCLGWNKSMLLKGREGVAQALEAASTGQGDLSGQLQRGCRRACCSQTSPTQNIQANGRISLPGNPAIHPPQFLHLKEVFLCSTLSRCACLELGCSAPSKPNTSAAQPWSHQLLPAAPRAMLTLPGCQRFIPAGWDIAINHTFVCEVVK